MLKNLKSGVEKRLSKGYSAFFSSEHNELANLEKSELMELVKELDYQLLEKTGDKEYRNAIKEVFDEIDDN